MNKSLKHVDISFLMDVFNGDKEIIFDCIDVFCSIANNYFTTIIEAHTIKNWHLLGYISHKAKTSCRTMGMSILGNSLEKVEVNAKGLKLHELMSKRNRSKEEEKLYLAIQKSGITQGNEDTINTEVSFIKTSYIDAIEEIIQLKNKLNKI